MNTEIIVEERSQIAQARREAVALARRLSIDERVADRLALAVTESATNLVKHAAGGKLLLAPLLGPRSIGVEVIAIDRGPGMQNVAASMRDGHSTAGSPGLGLGSISRLASNLDIYSQPGTGTVLRFEVWAADTPHAAEPARFGGVCVAMPGEAVAGDAWSVQASNGQYRLLVVDGLGHGPEAAMAAHTALRIADQGKGLDAVALLESVHAALRSTRGAAGAVATITPHAATGVFAGVGNIRGVVHTSPAPRNLVSHNGTLGHQLRKVQPFEFAFPARALLIMHSDGIATHWGLDRYPGLASRHPAVIAATIYRDHARGRDDATVVVLRNEQGAAR
jgi:anti-sigma regulatory factor (Ser/Thr protein kinase)